MFKEVGYPTQVDPQVNQQLQRDYYEQLQKTETLFAYFEAFDQYWKTNPAVEPFWGLWDKNRNPKLAVGVIGPKVRSGVMDWERYE